MKQTNNRRSRLKTLLVLALMLLAAPALHAQEAEAKEEEGGINLKEILFGHVQDS